MRNDKVKETNATIRSFVKKTHVAAKSGTQESNVVQPEDQNYDTYGIAGALAPPYDLESLTTTVDHSSILQQCIDAYCVNIDGFGHRLVPTIDTTSADCDEKIRVAMYLDRVRASKYRGEDYTSVELPTDEEVAATKKRLHLEILSEKNKLESFFESCCTDMSFVELRKRTRRDKESNGNGYWEVLRNRFGEVTQFEYVPSHTVRLMPLDDEPTEVIDRVRTSALSFEEVRVSKRFRRYVQVYNVVTMYFKEFGDPRIVSKNSGNYYSSLEELYEHDPNDSPATELLHFKIHNPLYAYGVPRWIGGTVLVLGSRSSEELNYFYFDNRSVPPLAVMVNGGRFTAETVERIESFFTNEGKGKENFGKVLVIEAVGDNNSGLPDSNGKMKIELKPLMDAQHNDAFFQKYEERCADKVGEMFRLPRLLRGDMRDFNKGTADVVLDNTEVQVFGPEREDFDYCMDRNILSSLNIKYWHYRSNAPTRRDPAMLAELITKLLRTGALVPADARDLAQGVFNQEFRKIDADWTKQPIQLTQVGRPVQSEGRGGVVTNGEVQSSPEQTPKPQVTINVPSD